VPGSEHDIYGRKSVTYKAMEYINEFDIYFANLYADVIETKN
jgi:hypothetical protein